MNPLAAGLALTLALAGPIGPPILWIYPPERASVPTVVLDDQFYHCHTLAAQHGDVVVLVYGSDALAEVQKGLGNDLHVAFHPAARGKSPAEARRVPVRPVEGTLPGARSPDVRVVPVACIEQVPSFTTGFIRLWFQIASPDLPVWIDFQKQVPRQCGLTPGVPNVAVLDTVGRLRCLTTGPLTPAQLAELAAIIEDLRRETVLPIP
jgi:hypothetical protein